MTQEDIWLFVYVGILFIGAPIFGIIVGLILNKKKKRIAAENGEEEEETPVIEPKTEFFEAKAVAKSLHTQFVGVKYVKSHFWYLITFETENGEKKELSVPPEVFENVTEGQTGTLVLVNGNFFDFGDGEEIDGEEMGEDVSNER